MTQNVNQKISKECRFAVYIPPPEPGMPDLHLIKENIHDPETNTNKPNVRLVENFERKFWTTKKGRRNHTQKKEWVDLDDVIEGKSTQTELVNNAAKALGTPWFKGDLRKLSESPYLYGTDITSTAIIKQTYREKYPGIQTRYSLAVFDTETDVVHGTEEIIMASLTIKDKCFTAVVKGFVERVADYHDRVLREMDNSLGEYVKARNIKTEIVIVENALECVRACFNKAHEIKPDFVVIWNINFDISKLLYACDKYGVKPEEFMCDPIVPPEYRFFKYKQGKTQKVTASGKITPIKPAAQWHTVTVPASFYLIDAMCVYKQVRIGKPEEQSYSLDNILNKNLGVRKLKFTEADHVSGLAWHSLMQQSYKVEYTVYNMFDCISIEILDEKTNDLSLTMPMFSGVSDFANFNSQPRRMADRLHFYCLSKGKVIGTTCSDMKDDMDEDTLDLTGWIITLPAHLVHDNGLCLIKENPEQRTNLRVMVGD